MEMSHSTNCHFVTCIYCRQYSLSGSGLRRRRSFVRSFRLAFARLFDGVEWSASDMVFIRKKNSFVVNGLPGWNVQQATVTEEGKDDINWLALLLTH